MYAFADNFSFFFRKLTAGGDGIFQRIGKNDGKLCGIDRECVRNGKMCFQRDILCRCPFQIGRQCGVQYGAAAIKCRSLKLILRNGMIDIIENGLRFFIFYKGSDGLKSVAGIM